MSGCAITPSLQTPKSTPLLNQLHPALIVNKIKEGEIPSFFKGLKMPIVKMPASITSKEALKIVQGQGFHTIISITELPDGSKLIEAK